MLALEDAKRVLRVTSDLMDGEVSMLLDAARADMLRAGVPAATLDGPSPLVAHAAALFCKSRFGYDNSEAARFEECYRAAVCDLVNSSYGDADSRPWEDGGRA